MFKRTGNLQNFGKMKQKSRKIKKIAEKRFSELVQNPKLAVILKKKSLAELMQQSELDVIGIHNNKIYLFEAAFHVDGILYGDNKGSTAKKVFEKLLRAYFIHLVYFPQCEYECIFATPKASSSTDKDIKENVKILNNEVKIENSHIFQMRILIKKLLTQFYRSLKMKKIFQIHSLDVSNC